MEPRNKSGQILRMLMVLGILVLLNLLGGAWFTRIDLTDDQRHTISEVSGELTRGLKDQAFVTVYYGGDLPTHYKEFERAMRTLLQEIQIQSDGRLDYQFIDPTEDPTIYRRFAEKQLYPFPISAPVTYGSSKEAQVLPYASVSYNQRELMINLIHNCLYQNESGQTDFSVECAIQRFEYNLMTTIYNLSREKYKTIGLLAGHGEYPREAMSDLYGDLDQFYNFVDVYLKGGKSIGPSNLDLLIVNQPDSALSEREKFEIDQYIMRGGQVIFLMDHQILDFSIGEQASTLTFLRSTNLDDFFMRLGVKLNYNLVKDANCGYIATTGFFAASGTETRKKFWPYYPIIRDISGHPTTRPIQALSIRYGSSIDTFAVEGIRKTVLFKSSPRSRKMEGRQFINIQQELAQKPDLRQFTDGGQIMGLLLEGQFKSLFANRPIPRPDSGARVAQEQFLSASSPEAKPRVILIGDGEFATADIFQNKIRPLPEENKALMMNLIDFMSGQEILTRLRVREYHGRTLDPQKVLGHETRIRMVNIGLPLLAVVIFGVVRWYLRRRRNLALKQES